MIHDNILIDPEVIQFKVTHGKSCLGLFYQIVCGLLIFLTDPGNKQDIQSLDVDLCGLRVFCYIVILREKKFDGVNLVTITGNGYGAQADIYISSGTVGVATLVNGGTGYQVGDVLGITTIGLSSIGRNARFSVVSIGNTNELILEKVEKIGFVS